MPSPHPDQAQVHHRLGDQRRAEGDFDAAEHHYRLAAGHGHPTANEALGRLYFELGEIEAAEAVFRTSTSDAPRAGDVV
jgi:uncharacterized protein HemY